MKSPAARLRNQIRFASTFKLKVKDFGAAQDRAVGFLRAFTPFVGWKEITLRVRPLVRSKAQEALYGYLQHAPPGVNWWAHMQQTFDRAALEARGVELDEVAHAALAGFGPAQFTSSESSSSGRWCTLTWQRTQTLAPADWLTFCAAHAQRVVDGFAQVSLLATSDRLELLDPTTGAPLPFQQETHYPPWRAGGSDRLRCEVHADLSLPRRDLSVAARLPFDEPDASFARYVEALDTALGQRLSRKHWYAVLASKAGQSQYERKLVW